MNFKQLAKVVDGDVKLSTGDIYNDGTYSGKVKEINGDSIILESQDEEGNVVDITIPKVEDAIRYIVEPSDDDILSSIYDPEFICQIIEEASDGENTVDSYVQNEDGTLDIHIKRPITQEEAGYLKEVGVIIGLEALNKSGWVTIGIDPVADSKVGKVEDSAVHTVKESNINDLLDKGETTVEYDPEETNPTEIVEQLEEGLIPYLSEREEIPELEVEVLSDNKITVFIS